MAARAEGRVAHECVALTDGHLCHQPPAVEALEAEGERPDPAVRNHHRAGLDHAVGRLAQSNPTDHGGAAGPPRSRRLETSARRASREYTVGLVCRISWVPAADRR